MSIDFLLPPDEILARSRAAANDESGGRPGADHFQGKLRPIADGWRLGGREPTLADVLADPLVHFVMRRDGVTLAELIGVIAEAQAKARRRLCARCMA
jgi:hypothetical protein